MRTVGAIAAWLVVSYAADAVAQDVDKQFEDVTQQLTERILESGAVTDPNVFAANGFRIESWRAKELGRDLKPDGTEFDYLDVTGAGAFRVGIEKGRPSGASGSVGIFAGPKGGPILVAADNDGDGSLDFLSYSVLDEAGESVLEVDDYGADGQADLRLHFRERYNELWHADRWYRVEKRDGRQGIVVDGEWLDVRVENDRLVARPASR